MSLLPDIQDPDELADLLKIEKAKAEIRKVNQVRADLIKQKRDKAKLKKAEKNKSKTIQKHKDFVIGKGRSYQGHSKVKKRQHRTPNCYVCHCKLDSEANDECNACGWIICECGACGCGYEAK